MKRISEEHLRHWREHGYTIVEDFLTPEELAAAQEEISRTFPSAEMYALAPTLYRTNYRGGHMKDLPFLGDILNFVAVDPEIVSFVERALGTKKLALSQSTVWGKYPGPDDFDMMLHMDYMTSTILYPNQRRPYEDVLFILYYVDVDEQLGATAVVSKRHNGGEPLVPVYRSRSEYPELYRRERPVHVRAGSLLIYDMTTLHRSSAITSPNRARYSHHIAYQREDATWMGVSAWATYGVSPEFQRFMGQASPRQRELLGFPPPGHAYWHEGTLVGIAARYPTLDMTPYVEAAKIPKSQRTRLLRELRLPRPDRTGHGMSAPQDGEHSTPPERALTDLAGDYYRGVADYCAAVTGVPTGYWLPLLLAYYRGTPSS
jgi:ectoine hydroxylase-related dioxygenase (phytanoyl-CoA dioxygenase family)